MPEIKNLLATIEELKHIGQREDAKYPFALRVVNLPTPRPSVLFCVPVAGRNFGAPPLIRSQGGYPRVISRIGFQSDLQLMAVVVIKNIMDFWDEPRYGCGE